MASSDDDTADGEMIFTVRASGGLNDRKRIRVTEADKDKPGLVIDAMAFDVLEKGTKPVSIRLTRGDLTDNVTVTTSWVSGDEDLRVRSGGTLTFTPGAGSNS